ncbi:MAG: apolipoprotein N-acyltransferase [Chlamydiia bacterium]|nr:apolipoprotein N-acyltransferase [Chlamydiia bacterium]
MLNVYVSILVSFALVAFGQPAWCWWSGLIAAAFGYALFWRVLLDIEDKKTRFWIASSWFGLVQIVQLSWLISHPFAYIWSVYLFFSALLGVQFGLVSLLVTKKHLRRMSHLAAVAALWTLFEWSRLFILSGFSWNPVGLALTGSLYPLQAATLFGIWGLSYWVIFVNLLFLRAWVKGFSLAAVTVWMGSLLAPYLFGMGHLAYHDQYFVQGKRDFSAVLVQTAFPIEEDEHFSDFQHAVSLVMEEWTHVLKMLKKSEGKLIDLVAFPEGVVPFESQAKIFPLEFVQDTFVEVFGAEVKKKLPAPERFAKVYATEQGPKTFVSNAYWAQAITDLMGTPVIFGMQHTQDNDTWSQAALYFQPLKEEVESYAKRVLIPMAEYLPCTFMQNLAQMYGVTGFFTPGNAAKVFAVRDIAFGVSVCYEETFGNLTRESRSLGADILVNMTNDNWFPNSRLPKQHFHHGRVRSVEMGIPVLRACNTGITSAIDSLGRIVKVLNEEDEWSSDTLHVDVPLYSYRTLYSSFGDALSVGLCLLLALLLCRRSD